MSQDERASDQIVARVAVAVFMDNPAQLRAAVPDFQEELQHWPMKNPRATWDEVTARLVLEVDVTADDRAVFGLEGYAEFVADQAYKITFATVVDLGDGGVRVLDIYPA